MVNFHCCSQASPEQSTGHDPHAQVDWRALIRAAIESSSHGLCIFDSQLRLVIANEHHRSIYGLAPVQALAGLSIEEILKSRLACVSGPAPVADHLTEYLAAIKTA